MLFELHDPASSRCVLIGARPAGRDLGAFRAILWLCDAPGMMLGTPDIDGTVEPVDIGRLTPALVAAAVKRFLFGDSKNLPSLLVGEDVLVRAPEQFQAVIAEVQGQLEGLNRVRLTRKVLAFTWQKHVFRNAAAYCRHRVPASWAGALEGLPAVVCGAGPSLDVSLAALVKAAGHAVVIAGDSSVALLARHGVEADFAVSIDAAKVPEKCLAGARLPGRVVLSPFSPPAWNEAVPPERIAYLSNFNLTIDWLADQGVARTGVGISESCGSTAIDLARYLGCSPIYLFGVDMAANAAAPAIRHHSGVDPSLYQASGYRGDRPCPRVPGNHAPEVSTYLLGDLRALNQRLATWPSGLVVNVNDRGARLANTTVVHPADFSLADPGREKMPRLEALGPAAGGDQPAVEAALLRLAQVVVRHSAAVAALRERPTSAAVAELVGGLRVLFSDQAFSKAMGAYSLKLVPLLLPPTDQDPAVWTALANELAELMALAEEAALAPVESGPGLAAYLA